MKRFFPNPPRLPSFLLGALMGLQLPAALWAAQTAPHGGVTDRSAGRNKPEQYKNERGRPAAAAAKPPNTQQQIERLANMSPEQRQQALAGLPPGRQRQIEQSLARYQQMTPKQRQNMAARAEKLQALPPDEQKQVREAAQAFRQLPEDRQTAIRKEMNKLRKLDPEKRDARMASPDFRSRFSSSEQDMIHHMGEVLPDPDI